MKKLNIYTIGKKELITTINVKNIYESSFCFRDMPTIGERTCKKILNQLYPNFKADGVVLVFEWAEDGYTGIQNLYRNGTILNF